MRTSTSSAYIAALLLCVGTAAGHGLLVDPKPSWVNPNGDLTAYCDLLDGPNLLPGGPYNLGPEDNANMFAKNFKASPYMSLRDFVNKNSATCGACGLTTMVGSTPQSINPAGTIQWKHDDEGFVETHNGPCEVWCDDSIVFQDDNCPLHEPSGLLRVDTDKCRKAKSLVIYWLALHSPQWQVYLNCVALGGSGTSIDPSVPPISTSSSPNATKNVPSTKAVIATPKPSPTSFKPTTTSYTPSPTSFKPPPTPYTPTTPKPATTRYPPQSTDPRSSTPYPSTTRQSTVARPWQQCGGLGYKGPTTCVLGFECIVLQPVWFSQCLAHAPVPSKEFDTWEQCGGKGFTKSLACKAGNVCVSRNDFFSQCVPF
ncbi:hypothetical protein DYB36_013441 [Aphanomyces astaci]|uniref:CBM1 domain-containing protein n=1 Tax=Aphanomyces astaci TaxID=112090 RepID=A0A396ZWY0_APHAT|nr:hypothetical protein DYB36_013441 [Aphanomyces astaci]